jgi:thymidylate synthase (FAD)
MQHCLTTYQAMIDAGVAREQARMILPLSVYTECIWTVSLQALLHFVRLRDESHAQEEIREYARILRSILEDEFPLTMRAQDN